MNRRAFLAGSAAAGALMPDDYLVPKPMPWFHARPPPPDFYKERLVRWNIEGFIPPALTFPSAPDHGKDGAAEFMPNNGQ